MAHMNVSEGSKGWKQTLCVVVSGEGGGWWGENEKQVVKVTMTLYTKLRIQEMVKQMNVKEWTRMMDGEVHRYPRIFSHLNFTRIRRA